MDSGAREGMESALHTNLLLLGIDAMRCPPPFTTGMFRSTNPKGTVFVLHFLLTTLKPDNSALASVWPVHDARQSSDFRRVALEMLKELENDGSLPRRNLLRATTLSTACGERLVELLWRLSTLALRHVYTTTYPAADLRGLAPPTPAPAPGSPAEAARVRVTQARVAVERRSFVERAAAGLKAAQAAEATAADLSSEYRELCKVKAEVGRERATLRAAGAGNTDDVDDARVTRLRELWDSLLKECEELDARAPTVTALLDMPEDVARGLRAVTLRQAATEPSPLAAALHPPSTDASASSSPSASAGADPASFASSSASSSVVADPTDLPRLIQQWTRGMHRCGKALAPLLRAYDAAAAGTANDDGEPEGDASEWVAHAQALAEQVEEHTTYVEVLTALAATLQRHNEHRAAHSSARTATV